MKRNSPTILALALTLLFTALGANLMHAQLRHRNYARLFSSDRDEVAARFAQSVTTAMSHRHDKSKARPAASYLRGEGDNLLWTNGVGVYSASYEPEERAVYFSPIPQSDDVTEIIEIKHLDVKGGTVVLSDKPNVKITVEQVAGRTLLVGRNPQGVPVMVLHNVAEEQAHNGEWTMVGQMLLWGNYQTPAGDYAVFGPRMTSYLGEDHRPDPGILDGYFINRDFKSIDIIYGNGRPSRGDPSDPRWGKMPGGGGAAAIMGPMEWNITPTVEGLRVVVSHDERFVYHNPSVGNEGDTVVLTLVKTPFEGLDGKWAIASVFPLTEVMLQLFPREILKLMRGEIYARYGDTFNDPATQRYFDAQPWYKRRSGSSPIRLTDVERFNYQLIKHVESTR